MLNSFAKYALISTSIAPVCITLAFLALINKQYGILAISLLIVVLSTLICYFIINQAKKHNPVTHKNLRSAKLADREITNYFLTYLFPLISWSSDNINWMTAAFFYVSLFIYVRFSSAYSFNPIISIVFGYKFYEAEDDTGVGFVLMTKEYLQNAQIDGMKMKQISDHTYLKIE